MEDFQISRATWEEILAAEEALTDTFKEHEDVRLYNQLKVIKAFQEVNLASTDFRWATGYGYGDVGREKLEKVFAHVFHGESALVRPAIASGTHALALTMQGLLRPGDELVYISGTPYDTMLTVIGLTKNEPGNLLESKIKYKEVPLYCGKLYLDAILKTVSDRTKLAVLQRSSGYSERSAFTIAEMELVFQAIKEQYPDVIIMVDNCYGEFTEKREPLEAGAHILAGSLIKNPGGGIAPGGGYIVGRDDLIHQVANRLTAPGIGREGGLMFDMTRSLFQGLYLAPHVVHEALKGAILFSKLFEDRGYITYPEANEVRSDIITVIELKDKEKVISFCQTIQEASCVDSYITPIPWDMPGYDFPVIMAAGGIIEGSSIELSADGPIREPYSVFYQGGLTFDQCKLAAAKVLEKFKKEGF